MLNQRSSLVAVAALFLAASFASAQSAPSDHFASPLSRLADKQDGKAMHEGSWDRRGGNKDMRRVNPGQTLTIFEHEGAGCVHRFWITNNPLRDVEIESQVILRIYWDGEENPSVECPIGAFFGVGFGETRDYISLPLNETSGGFNCYWPMPFHKSAKWTITNTSKKPLLDFFWNIDYTALDSVPESTRHFHAQFRRENPTTKDKNYTILETTGEGHYVGTALFMHGLKPRDIGFLEGDEMVYVDGEEKPSINGTGTEDYFSSGWYFDRGLYSAPYHGVTILDNKLARVSAYRWHIEDAIPFKKSIRFTIEHGTNNNYLADYSSVAYYYLAGATPKGPGLPTDLLPSVPPPVFKIKGAIEGEDLLPTAKASTGELSVQNLEEVANEWSGGNQLWWVARELNGQLTLQLPAPADGDYDLTARMTTANDYGTVQFLKDGTALGAPVDLYSATVTHKDVPLGKVSLKKGDNAIVIKTVGKNEKATSYLVGVDAFVLKAVK